MTKRQRLRDLVRAEKARRAEAAAVSAPLHFVVVADDSGTAGAMTDADEAMKAATLVREGRRRHGVTIVRSIAAAVGAAARAANPRSRCSSLMHWIVQPGDDVPEGPWFDDSSGGLRPRPATEATSPADEPDPDLVDRIAARVAALRDGSGAGKPEHR